MARARDVPGLTTELPYGEAAALVIEVRCEELMSHSEHVLDVERIEGVHDMRVATRRLRAAIEVFWPCLPKKLRKRALAEVKDLADALGERRDRDVAIATLERFAEAMPTADRPGVASLVAELRDEQQHANEGLAGEVDAARLGKLRDELLALAAAAREAAQAG